MAVGDGEAAVGRHSDGAAVGWRHPSNLVGGDSALSSVLNINANRNITSLFSQFGKVKHSTVRVKAGENKSWALITFEDVASAKACHDEGITVMDANHEEIQLRVSYGASPFVACVGGM